MTPDPVAAALCLARLLGPRRGGATDTLVPQLRHSLRTANLELSLAQSKQAIEAIVKDEEIRKLRVSQCLLQDQVDELHEQLEEEQARSDGLEDQLDQASLSLDQYKADTESAQQQIRTQSREIANLRVRKAPSVLPQRMSTDMHGRRN